MPRKRYATLVGIKYILDYIAETDVKAKKAQPQDFVDIKELDDSGYTDSLYK